MPILDAVLAFAITIFIVATIVSQFVSILRNGATIRNRHLQNMLTDYFDHDFKPVIDRDLSRLKEKISLSADVEKKLDEVLSGFNHSKLFKSGELEKMVDVSTEELTEQLKHSEPGKLLLAEFSDESQKIFDELGKRYEIIGHKY